MLALIAAAHSAEDRIEGGLSKCGLSMAKLTVLTKLVEAAEPLTLGEIASRLACVRSNVTQLVDRLEADGLVRRIDDANDRRSVRAELTDEGRKRQRDGSKTLDEVQESFESELGGAEGGAALMSILSRIS